MFKMRHTFGFLRNALKHFQNAPEGVPDAPFSRNCARFGSTGMQRMTTAASSYPSSIDAKSAYATVRQPAASTQPALPLLGNSLKEGGGRYYIHQTGKQDIILLLFSLPNS